MSTFKQFLNEQQFPQYTVNLAHKIVDDCEPYLSQHSKFYIMPLFRGTRQSETVDIKQIRSNREPKDMPRHITQLLDQWFEQQFGIRFRTNAMFATGDQSAASSYGPRLTAVYPIGQFDFLWSPNVPDLYNVMWHQVREILGIGSSRSMFSLTKEQFEIVQQQLPERLQQLDFKFNEQLSKAVASNNEVMISGDKYYSVNFHWQRENYLGNAIYQVRKGDL